MVSLVILGNCQTDAIQFLLEHMMTGADIKIIDASYAQSQSEDFIARALPVLCAADYILCQNATITQDARKILEKEAKGKLLLFANLYFRGLHPDLCFLDQRADRDPAPSYSHLLPVLDAYKRGKSLRYAQRSLSFEGFERLSLLGAFESSLAELEKRDEKIDVPAALLVRDFCRCRLGFTAINHPALGLLHDYLVLLLKKLGLPFQAINTAGLDDPLGAHDVFPIYDFWAEHLGLPYRTSQLFQLSYPGQHFLTQEKMVEAYYRKYDSLEEAALIVNSPYDLCEALDENAALTHLRQPMKRQKKFGIFG